MTKNQIESHRIKMAGRLNEISGLEGDAFTDAIRAEASTLETEYRDSGVKLQAALAVEDAERQVAEREAAALGSLMRAIPNSANGSNCGAVRGSVGSWRRPFQAVRSMASKPSIGRACW